MLLFSLSFFATGCYLTARSSEWVCFGKTDMLYNILFSLIFLSEKILCRKPKQVHINKPGFSDILRVCVEKYSELCLAFVTTFSSKGHSFSLQWYLRQWYHSKAKWILKWPDYITNHFDMQVNIVTCEACFEKGKKNRTGIVAKWTTVN